MQDIYILERLGIKAASTGEWQVAIENNQAILDQSPDNIPALNRLAKAYIESGQLKIAENTLLHILSLDPLNNIATNNLSRVKSMIKTNSTPTTTGTPHKQVAISFIEEPGKTKIVKLVKLAEPSVLAQLCVGQELSVKCNGRIVKLVNNQNQYIGRFTDDFCLLLGKLIRAGNRYQFMIKSVGSNEVEVFIIEIRRVRKFKGQPSFETQSVHIPSHHNPNLNEIPLEIYDDNYLPEEE